MRAGRSIGLTVIWVVLVAGATACSPPTEDPAPSVSGVVDGSGIELHLDGVTVVAGPDVAPEGTTMKLVRDARPLDDLGAHATALSGGISITLGDGLQPASPISLTFDLDDDLSDGVDVDGTVVPNVYAVASQNADGDWAAPIVAEADIDAGTVTAQVTHLSWFSPISVAIGEAWKVVKQSLGIESPRPDCAVDEPELNGVRVAAQPWNAWVCLTADGDGVAVQMTSNANLPFIFETVPAARVTSSPGLSFSAILSQAFFDNSYPGAGDLLLQGGSVALDFEGATPDVISMRQDQTIMMLRILLDVVGVFVPDKAAQALFLDEFGGLECAGDLVETALSPQMSVDQVSSFTGAFFSCASAALDAPGASIILWVLGAAPGALVTLVHGALNEVTGIDEAQVVFLSTTPTKPPSGCEQMNAAAYQRGARSAEQYADIPPYIETGVESFEYVGGPLAVDIMRKAVAVRGCAYPTSLETSIEQWTAQLRSSDAAALVDGLRASPDYTESTAGTALVFTANRRGEDNGIHGDYIDFLTYAFVGDTWIALTAMEETTPYLDSALAGVE